MTTGTITGTNTNGTPVTTTVTPIREPPHCALVMIHLGNQGLFFDAYTASVPFTTTSTNGSVEEEAPVVQNISCPTLTMAVDQIHKNFTAQNSKVEEEGDTSYVFDTIHIILNHHELHEVWTNTMDLALLTQLHSQTHASPTSQRILVHIVQDPSTFTSSTITTGTAVTSTSSLQVIHTSFLLAGLQCTDEQKLEYDHGDSTLVVRILTAHKIGASTASSSSISRLKAIPIIKAPTTTTTMTAAVTISLDNNNDDDDDLIDEDDLLQDEGLYNAAPPPQVAVPTATGSKNLDDCGGRTACDDCTCGRKELESSAGGSTTTTTTATTLPPMTTSACGKCGMGDAFRCASCPYLGKPAFRPGQEHLVLDLQDDL